MATLGGYLNSKSPPQSSEDWIKADTHYRKGPDRHSRLENPRRNTCSLRQHNKLGRHLTPPPLQPPLTDPSQVLNNAIERIIRTPDDPEPSAQVPLGLYLVRGDNVCSIGLVDEALDDSINWTEVKGSAIGGIKHT